MIKFYYGTVGSGKSMHLIAEYLNTKRRFPEKNVCLMKPASDTRTDGVFTRFGNIEIKADILVSEEHPWPDIHKYDTFFIDEAQFIPEWVINTAFMYSYDWHFYGLRNDSNKKMWPSILKLMNYADELIELPTVCEICKKNKASFNKSLKRLEDAQHSLGFHFIPVCGNCY